MGGGGRGKLPGKPEAGNQLAAGFSPTCSVPCWVLPGHPPVTSREEGMPNS